MTIRRSAHLFITLFTMMLCMGLPELQQIEDISYLRLGFFLFGLFELVNLKKSYF